MHAFELRRFAAGFRGAGDGAASGPEGVGGVGRVYAAYTADTDGLDLGTMGDTDDAMGRSL
ncbi:hypothetical protein ACFW6E_37665 [Streptomyces olivaceoviridis]|uniref:hypothetical protein n=1 Tax=Streptomyces olivaceoviridis TaxID=1921 RepID=UPI00369544F2